MKTRQIKLWDNVIRPCTQQVPESTIIHLYLCLHPTVAITQDTYFHKILMQLEVVNTDPLMVEIIAAFWHGESLVLDPVCPESLKSIYNTLRDIDLHQMWLGLLSTDMIAC